MAPHPRLNLIAKDVRSLGWLTGILLLGVVALALFDWTPMILSFFGVAPTPTARPVGGPVAPLHDPAGQDTIQDGATVTPVLPKTWLSSLSAGGPIQELFLPDGTRCVVTFTNGDARQPTGITCQWR
jgi:hypothetical protein